MRTIRYTCDRCGKELTSAGTTKINTAVIRGLDSPEKKNYDFCTKCFIEVKKTWKQLITEGNRMKKQAYVPVKYKTDEDIEPKPAEQKPEVESTSAAPKKRGRKPNPVDVNEWKNRTEMVYGPIKQWEKDLILTFHVRDGLTAEQIAEKLHRIPKGIKRAITSAKTSGKLEELKKEYRKSEDEERGEDLRNVDLFGRIQRGTYMNPSDIEVIDGVRYDIGSILALRKAGWSAKEISKEKIDYDEDVIRTILESREG